MLAGEVRTSGIRGRRVAIARHGLRVTSPERWIRGHHWFARRAQLIAAGFSDADLRAALGSHAIFRVRHGWYSVPDAPADAIAAVRTGGRLTGVAALLSYGLRVPRRTVLDVAVPGNACRLRDPANRRERLTAGAVNVHWVDTRRRLHRSPWRVSIEDALVHILRHESRDVAVACASALLRHRRLSAARVAAAFARAPRRSSGWRELISALDDSHGETFVRLWLMDAGVVCESQPYVPGVGHLDLRVSKHVYIEVDGAQHDPEWSGEGESSYQDDHRRDAVMATQGDHVLRYTYQQLYSSWSLCLAGIERAIADDLELTARRLQQPAPPRLLARLRNERVYRKRRRSPPETSRSGVSPP